MADEEERGRGHRRGLSLSRRCFAPHFFASLKLGIAVAAISTAATSSLIFFV